MQSKNELPDDLLSYVSNLIKNHYTCKQVKTFLGIRSYSLEQFIGALALIKYGSSDSKSYRAAYEEFETKNNLEVYSTFTEEKGFANKIYIQTPFFRKTQAVITESERIETDRIQFKPYGPV